jgi:hypothetical protein
MRDRGGGVSHVGDDTWPSPVAGDYVSAFMSDNLTSE